MRVVVNIDVDTQCVEFGSLCALVDHLLDAVSVLDQEYKDRVAAMLMELNTRRSLDKKGVD